ncbi:polysaccharide pyruvyl transferase family protein [Stutzerimonas tarimensis]|uniref:Polysaccharide pyruvyl transferase family protein n=1 Tax=Stutzerimonas tarimensis TaxID=1507735 RepID=A0ABV7T5T1_9GAMM
MKNVYFSGISNIGDELNRYIWPAVLGSVMEEDDRAALLGVGTLLSEDFNRRTADCDKVLVFGSGAGYGRAPAFDARWHFACVRGRHTSRLLGLDDDLAVADAAYLLATLDWSRQADTSAGVVVIPHHSTLGYVDWAHLCAEAGLTFLSPTLPASEFFQRLTGARLVLAEAMHGAILADVCRIPWVPFRYGQDFLEWKWLDWTEMFDLKVEIAAAEAFYDPRLHWTNRGRAFHLGRQFKRLAVDRGLGRAKWKKIVPPGDSQGAAGARMVGFLEGLARQEGYLSSDHILSSRVDELYARLNSLAQRHLQQDAEPLAGPARALFG